MLLYFKQRGNLPAPNRLVNTAKLMPASRFNNGKTSEEYAKGTSRSWSQSGSILGILLLTWPLTPRVEEDKQEHEHNYHSESICFIFDVVRK